MPPMAAMHEQMDDWADKQKRVREKPERMGTMVLPEQEYSQHLTDPERRPERQAMRSHICGGAHAPPMGKDHATLSGAPACAAAMRRCGEVRRRARFFAVKRKNARLRPTTGAA